MSEDFKARLADEVRRVEDAFNALGAEIKSLQDERAKLERQFREQIGAIDRRMSEKQAEQLRLQGEYRALQTLENPRIEVQGVVAIPEKKKAN